LCTNCGGNPPICLQRCPFDAIVYIEKKDKAIERLPAFPKADETVITPILQDRLPTSLRVSIRGIGGQGNLFFGRVLSEVALRTPYADTHIVKGETHGMAQLGGPVISTFSCGEVFSPILAPQTADVLVAMEVSEILRQGFLAQLKPEGTVIINNFKALPVDAKKEDYPADEYIDKIVEGYKVIKIDANQVAYDIGDKSGRTANVVVIGLLSTIPPFNAIPEEIWLSALINLSPNEFIKSANISAFRKGKEISDI
jgi:indolepyruvate ferredoxin oxidoreductase alpha subunit